MFDDIADGDFEVVFEHDSLQIQIFEPGLRIYSAMGFIHKALHPSRAGLRIYSYRKASAGLVVANLTTCEPTVNNAMVKMAKLANKNGMMVKPTW